MPVGNMVRHLEDRKTARSSIISAFEQDLGSLGGVSDGGNGGTCQVYALLADKGVFKNARLLVEEEM